MLRKPYDSEPELLRLCRAKNWDTVSKRSISHPSEAVPTDSALRGMGCTALSIATRSRAPLGVIEQLLRANWVQVGVTHSARGSILHDALKHRASDEILESLVKAVIHYEATRHCQSGECILGGLDELGRTPLHYMVDRILRTLDRGERSSNSWNILRLMVESYPDAISVIDADGTTPLVLLLLIPKFSSCNGQGDDVEDDVYRMVRLMLSLYPRAVQVSRRLPRPWHYHFNYDNQEPLVHGDGVPSPLSCALLHGRSVQTIELLLEANRKIGVQACRSLVTHYREVPLHIVSSMRCAPDLLKKLIQEDNVALGVSDIYGLKPLDWIWIRHTLDWCSSSEPFAPVMVSRRRYIHTHFLDWYRRVSNQYLGVDKPIDVSPNPDVRAMSMRLKSDLLQRMCIVLPEMVLLQWREEDRENDVDIDMGIREELGKGERPPSTKVSERPLMPLLHAAAFVSCPLAMIQLACDAFPADLVTFDTRMRRLPLHYAATRKGYGAQFPIGASCSLHNLEEVSPLQAILARFPEASRVTDGRSQLALHIAIDYVKDEKMRLRSDHGTISSCSTTTSSASMDVEGDDETDTSSQSSSRGALPSTAVRINQPGHQEIGGLLHAYPESLYRRDGVTRLYPFQQAAEGENGDLELSYMLLRHDPSLVKGIDSDADRVVA